MNPLKARFINVIDRANWVARSLALKARHCTTRMPLGVNRVMARIPGKEDALPQLPKGVGGLGCKSQRREIRWDTYYKGYRRPLKALKAYLKDRIGCGIRPLLVRASH